MTPKVLPSDDDPSPKRDPVEDALTRAHRLKLFRVTLLVLAFSAPRRGLPLSSYHTEARASQFKVSLQDVERELQYLVDKSFVAYVPQIISPEILHYRITAAGRDFLAENGLEPETNI
jgi:hypothetical protein